MLGNGRYEFEVTHIGAVFPELVMANSYYEAAKIYVQYLTGKEIDVYETPYEEGEILVGGAKNRAFVPDGEIERNFMPLL